MLHSNPRFFGTVRISEILCRWKHHKESCLLHNYVDEWLSASAANCTTTVAGQSLDSHWIVNGQSLDSHWTVFGQPLDIKSAALVGFGRQLHYRGRWNYHVHGRPLSPCWSFDFFFIVSSPIGRFSDFKSCKVLYNINLIGCVRVYLSF
jgi:hypothetical protein